MTKISRKTAWMLGASLIGVAMPLVAAAQTAAPDQETKFQVEEIIVSAQRRNESKQDVPVTVTVLGQAAIQEARIATVGDVVQRVPGVGFSGFPASEPRISVRGIGSSSRGASGDPSSAVFVDEIYNGRPSGIAFDAFDVARIEVLKGPQGTLFGRNVTGGAVNIVTNRPNLGAFDASAEATYGTYDQTDLAGYVNVPFADGKAAVRLGAALHQHDGYVDRINAAGNKVGELEDQNTRSGRAQLRFEPTDRLRLLATVDVAKDRNKGPGNRIAQFTQASGGFVDRFFIDPYKYKTYATIDGQQNRDVTALRLKGEYDLAFATLSYLGSHKHLKYVSNYDFDGALDKITTPADQTRDIEGGDSEKSSITSHEVQLKSLPDSALTWVAGVFNYSADTVRTNATRSLRNPAVRRESIYQDASTDSWAGYADITVPVTDAINVFGGARYTKDRKSIHAIGTYDVSPLFYLVTPYDATARKSWSAWSWRAGADWHINRDLMIYGSISRGFKSGGFQDTPGTAADLAVSINPEFATAYEFGQRGTFMDGRIVWNNSVFYTKYDNLQNRVRDPVLNTNSIRNAFATIYGYETEISIKASEALRIDAGYAYTHARYDDFASFVGATPVNYKGNVLDATPTHKVTFSPSYTQDLGVRGTLELALDYAYTSRIYDNETNNPFNTRDASHVVDARAIFKPAGDHWSLSFWGKNLTKAFVKTYDGLTSGAVIAAYSPPRTFGATLRWRY